VNPVDGWNNTQDVVNKAIRAKAKGMRVMIDFHYSDSWADPGQQTKPAAWVNMDITALQEAVYTHTFQVLSALKQNGVIPTWVQIGNETNNGMLWPTGMASQNMSNFASLLKQGYNAVKAVDSSMQVIIHLSNGYDNSMYRWMFDGLQANGVKWDIIGMSLYPPYNDWKTKNEQCLVNMNDMLVRYGRPIMVCEVGMNWDQPDSSYVFLKDIIAKTKSLGATKGLGVFYWEPQCMPSWKGYTLGAFDNSNKPTKALDAFNN
jgi:arabinogalactan endo-1,4-beta-galactosidase